MVRRQLVEGILLLAAASASMAEGLRLASQPKDVHIQDVIGPGFYLFFLGLPLLAVSVAHMVVSHKKSTTEEKPETDRKMRIRMLLMTATLGAYILAIDIVGYLAASFLFFLLELRIVGIKSWAKSIVSSIAFAVIYYLVFVRFCNMIFPTPVFLR
jgi:hypothetical protein